MVARAFSSSLPFLRGLQRVSLPPLLIAREAECFDLCASCAWSSPIVTQETLCHVATTIISEIVLIVYILIEQYNLMNI